MEQQFQKLKQWLLYSGLVSKNDENYGGVHAYYDQKNKKYGFLYPEITGYFLSTLRFLNSIEKNDFYLTSAKASAEWLIKIHDKHGGIIQGINTHPSKQKLVYTFDNGICAKGFLDCFHLTNDEKYLQYGKKLVDWMINEALEEDGTLKPFKNLNTNRFEENSKLWYAKKGCLHIKLAIPIVELYHITNDQNLLDKISLICDNYSKFQNPDGSFSTNLDSKVIHIHSLCYAVEGLFHAYTVTNNKKYLESCKKALEWSTKFIQDDGSINLWFNSNNTQAKTCYHIAQLIRLMILMDKHENNNHFHNYVKSMISFLNKMQATDENIEINGGLYEEFYKSLFGWKLNQRVNSWGSMFALQAFHWTTNLDKISLSDSITHLY